jgi:hypothetical protein
VNAHFNGTNWTVTTLAGYVPSAVACTVGSAGDTACQSTSTGLNNANAVCVGAIAAGACPTSGSGHCALPVTALTFERRLHGNSAQHSALYIGHGTTLTIVDLEPSGADTQIDLHMGGCAINSECPTGATCTSGICSSTGFYCPTSCCLDSDSGTSSSGCCGRPPGQPVNCATVTRNEKQVAGIRSIAVQEKTGDIWVEAWDTTAFTPGTSVPQAFILALNEPGHAAMHGQKFQIDHVCPCLRKGPNQPACSGACVSANQLPLTFSDEGRITMTPDYQILRLSRNYTTGGAAANELTSTP